MPAKPDIAALRTKAGQRYAAALDELKESLVDLAAIEGVVGAQRAQVPTQGGAANMLTFAAAAPDNLPELRHREFAPNPPSRLKSAIAARAEEYQAQLTG